MSAHLIPILGLCLAATACATAPKTPEGPQVVQLSLSGTPEPCDWSGHYEPLDVPDQWALGATYWPRNLTFYGSATQFVASETSPIICLRLFKRPSMAHTGIAPVAVIQILPEGQTARVTALRLDRKITRLDLGLAELGSVQPIEVSLVGDQFVEQPSQGGASDQESPTVPHEGTLQVLTLDMTKGRAEGRIASLSFIHQSRLALVASQARTADGAPTALKALLSSTHGGATEARFENQALSIHPR